uniref:Carbonic anhydrase n=1 Tax=Paracoccidioides brasiliensis TaxID=121759 RepID=B1PIT4_PARBR|nr:carbonic anhydrase [Paracoccidioides brasiliensis]
MKSFFIAALVFLNAKSVLSSCAHGTHIYPRAAGDVDIDMPKFGYGYDDGPTIWHRLSTAYALCGSGTQQSPIDIDSTIATMPAGFLSMNIPMQDVKFENLNTTVEVILEGTTMVNGSEFLLKQFHFHTPSEHTLSGEKYPAEIHMVNLSKDDPKKIVVITLIVQATAGSSISSLGTVISYIDRITQPSHVVDIPQFNISDVGVAFYILTQALPMHIGDFNVLKGVLKYNSRFLQSPQSANRNVLVAAAGALPSEIVCNGRVATSAAATTFIPRRSLCLFFIFHILVSFLFPSLLFSPLFVF